MGELFRASVGREHEREGVRGEGKGERKEKKRERRRGEREIFHVNLHTHSCYPILT